MEKKENQPSGVAWRQSLNEIIFGAETTAGKAFDIILIASILISVFLVMMDSVAALHLRYSSFFFAAEWVFTILFTIEYLLRLLCVNRPLHYATSFFGIVDVLAILPTYLALFVPGGHLFLVIRVLRLLRIFRVFKLVHYLKEAQVILMALKASRRKILVFLIAVLTIVTICGSFMYVLESEESGFTSIPRSIYWAIVTLTTVGYGDISPQTNMGQVLATVIMLIGFAIIAVPTGIVTAELSRASENSSSKRVCPRCTSGGHVDDACYCKDCGALL